MDLECKVIVTGLKESVSGDEVKRLFKTIGQVVDCSVSYIAFVTFNRPADAREAIGRLDGDKELGENDEGIKVTPDREVKKHKLGSDCTVYVTGLRESASEDNVKQLFESCGQDPKCYLSSTAYVVFEKPADAAKAVKELGGNTKCSAGSKGIKVKQSRSPRQANPRQNDEDSDEDNDKQICLTTKKLDAWIKDHQVTASILRNAANGGDQNRGESGRYSIDPTDPGNNFDDPDHNARKLRIETPKKKAQVQGENSLEGHEASKTEELLTKGYRDPYLEYTMEKKLLPHPKTTFVFTNKALRAIGSTHSEADNPYDRGSKLIIEKVEQNYFVHATNTEADEEFNKDHESSTLGFQFEEVNTQGKPKKKGKNWFSVVSRECSVTPKGSQPLNWQVIARGEIDAYVGEESDKELVEMKSMEKKTIEEALHHKGLIWWLQCEFANVDWLFLGEVSKENGRRELLSFETLRNEVRINDQKRAQAAIFKIMIFVNEKFKKDETYVLERGSKGTTYRKGAAEDRDKFISQDLRDQIERYANERN